MPSPTPLPGLESVGKAGTWTIQDQHGQSITITGELLGLGSSFRPRHQNHPDATFAPPRTHCSTCRWTEIRIFAVDSEVDNPAPLPYLVVKSGVSVAPGEKNFTEWEGLVTGDEVLEKLTTRRGRDAFLTMPASRAASQAASFDPGMREAWTQRAVK